MPRTVIPLAPAAPFAFPAERTVTPAAESPSRQIRRIAEALGMARGLGIQGSPSDVRQARTLAAAAAGDATAAAGLLRAQAAEFETLAKQAEDLHRHLGDL